MSGADAKAVDGYSQLFGVSPDVVRRVLGNGQSPPAAQPPTAPSGPAPGDPGFASSVMGSPQGAPSPSPPKPTGPAPGDPGFDITKVGSGPAPPPQSAPLMKALQAGAGQIDTSGVAPKGFGTGAVHLSAKGGQPAWDLSGVTAPRGLGEPAPTREEPGGAPPGASQGTYVPGGWQHASRGESRHLGIDESKLAPGQKERAVADNYGQWAADDTRQAMQKEAAADVEYATAKRDLLQQDAARQQAIANEKRAYVADEHAKLNDLAQAAQKQVDPEAAKGSNGAQLLAALGVAMGQFGASLTGGTNAALQIVQSNIDRRIKAQEANIANAHKSLDNERSLYKDNLEAFGDRERAALATKVQYFDQAKAMLDEQYAAAKGNRNDAQYHAMSQGLADKRAEALDQFGVRTSDQVETQSHDAYRPAAVVGASGATPEAKKDAHEYSEELEKAGIPQSLASLQEIDSRLDALGSGDIAGIGPVVNHVPSSVYGLFGGKEGVANRQAVAHVKNEARKTIAGASLTDGEKVELNKELEGAGNADSLRNFVHSFRRKVSNQQKNIAAGHGPEGRALYQQRGGSVKDVEMNKRTTPLLKPVDE